VGDVPAVAPASDGSRSWAQTAAAPGAALVFHFGNGAFINTAAPANSPQQQLTDRVFRALGLERAEAGSPPAVGLHADTLAHSIAAELVPGERSQDLVDSLFREGRAADLDWLADPIGAIEVSSRVDADVKITEAAGDTAAGNQDAVSGSVGASTEAADDGEGAETF
jgi:hypothetical protein